MRNDRLLSLNELETIRKEDWLLSLKNSKKQKRLFFVTSGYEKRSINWTLEVVSKIPPSNDNHYAVIGFKDYCDVLSRPDNDKFYNSKKIKIDKILDSTDTESFKKYVIMKLKKIKKKHKSPLEIHVDYSCMPRKWYCNLPIILEENLSKDDMIYFWYTGGKYKSIEYPTAGIDDFNVFSGKPRIGTKSRVHIIGLGFDTIRTQAIWSVLDPQNLICYYAKPGIKKEYDERVESNNSEIIKKADHVFTVPLKDFVYTLSKMISLVTEFHLKYDVILVPDGPKPLVLAASLIPLYLNRNGIVCHHITRKQSEYFKPIDVTPIGEYFGFRFRGKAN